MHTVSLIFVHSFHYTDLEQKESFFTPVRRCPGMHKCTKPLPFPSCCWHNTHTHKPDQRPCPGNLFQPICAAVRVGLIVSCVCNVSETVIGKSFETLKSFRLPLSSIHSSTSPLSLFHCQTQLHHCSVSCSYHLHPSTFPYACSIFLPLCFPPSVLSSSFSLLRISLQLLCVDWRLPLSWYCWHT